MRVLLTGGAGQVGVAIQKLLADHQGEFLSTDKINMDITKQKEVDRVMDAYNPDLVLHCAAYTNVEQAEQEETLCRRINVLGTKNVAISAYRKKAKLVYLSTDYVFDGRKETPYDTTDFPHPINVYGQSKYEGELVVQDLLKEHFIVRTSWLFGGYGRDFVKTMLSVGNSQEEVKVVCDQWGSPTYIPDLARWLLALMQTEQYGIHHVTNEGYCSWYEFASEIARRKKLKARFIPVASEEFSMKAKRPRNSRLVKTSLSLPGLTRLSTWEEALADYLLTIRRE